MSNLPANQLARLPSSFGGLEGGAYMAEKEREERQLHSRKAAGEQITQSQHENAVTINTHTVLFCVL